MTDRSDTPEPQSSQAFAERSFTIGFGNECNEYVDVIQQALDLALGNTGNLAPDSAVVDALDQLYTTAHGAGATELLQLLVPLSQVLRSAELAGFTLSQADTLLVQEAIIAITLGIDSIVNQKPTPVLLADVTQRVVDVAAENKHEIRANSEATGLVNVFVADADELLQRLFEQIQRWRASAFVGRGYEEVNRLLVTLHNSADAAGLSSIVTVVRLLIERMSAQRVAEEVPDDKFFDLATETIEILGDDLDRIRNNEQLIEHVELYEQLTVDGARPATKPPLTANADIPAMQGEILPAELGLDSAAKAGLANHRPVPVDFQALGNPSGANWPHHSEMVDALRSISRGNDAIKERIEQLRRTIHAYPEARHVTVESGVHGSAVSAVDNLFFKIDAILSTQRKAVSGMASVLGVEDQQTVAALGAGLVRHSSLPTLPVQYLNEASRVVIDSQLFDHLGYALRIALEAVVLPPLAHDASAAAYSRDQVENSVVFDRVDDQLVIRIVGSHLQLSEFVVANASLRKVDEHMLKTQLPRPVSDESSTLASPRPSFEHSAASVDELATLAVFQRLIDLAAFHQGRVSTSLHWSGAQNNIVAPRGACCSGEIEMRLPVSSVSEELVVVKHGNQLYAVQSAALDGIEQRTHGNEPEQVLLRCTRRDGEFGYLYAEKILGKQMASVTRSRLLMLGDAYCGAFVNSDSNLVLVVDPDALAQDAPVNLAG